MKKALVGMGIVVALAVCACSSGSGTAGGVGGGGGGGSGNSGGGGGALGCSDVCPAVVAANCSNGPTTVNDCVSGCEQVRAKCGSQWDAVMACAGQNPQFSCSASGTVEVQGCSTQYSALNTCAASP